MKKLLCGFLIGIISSFCVFVYANNVLKATPASFDIIVNGEKFTTNDKPAVVIDGSTYLPLRAIGNVLNVPVEWNAENKRVEVGKSKVLTQKLIKSIKSNSLKINDINDNYPFISKDNKCYVPLTIFNSNEGLYVKSKTENGNNNMYLVFPGKEPVLVRQNKEVTDKAIMKDNRIFADIEACGLKWTLDGDTLWVEV